MMCRVLKVTRIGYYAWRDRQPSQREREDRALARRIHSIHRQSREAYGSPRIHAQLRREGTAAGRHRVARLMRWEGLRGCAKRRFRRTASVRSPMPAAPDLLEGDFSAPAPNRVWVGDITQIRTREGWLYIHHTDRGGQYLSAEYQDLAPLLGWYELAVIVAGEGRVSLEGAE